MIDKLLEPVAFAQFITALFLAALFLQSGLDKVFDFSGNHNWLKSHFSKSLLRHQVKAMLLFITIAEVLAGALLLFSAAQIALSGEKTLALYGAQLASLDILMLFFGQRMAKDYAGAAALVPYFILCIGEVVLLGQ